MKESDWKVFKEIKKGAIEKFCTNVLYEFLNVINNENENVHERYLQLYKLVQDRDEEMAMLFDEHSRSKATWQLFYIRQADLADRRLLEKLSEECFKQSDPEQLK